MKAAFAGWGNRPKPRKEIRRSGEERNAQKRSATASFELPRVERVDLNALFGSDCDHAPAETNSALGTTRSTSNQQENTAKRPSP
jgi:hypothetical protein